MNEKAIVREREREKFWAFVCLYFAKYLKKITKIYGIFKWGKDFLKRNQMLIMMREQTEKIKV